MGSTTRSMMTKRLKRRVKVFCHDGVIGYGETVPEGWVVVFSVTTPEEAMRLLGPLVDLERSGLDGVYRTTAGAAQLSDRLAEAWGRLLDQKRKQKARQEGRAR